MTLLYLLKPQIRCINGYRWTQMQSINEFLIILFPIWRPLFSLHWALFLVYVWPFARLSRWSYNKYSLIKLDRVAMLSYDYGSFYNMKTPCLSYSWSKIKSEIPALISTPLHDLYVTTSKITLKEHKPVYLHTVIDCFHLWLQPQQIVCSES